ncbi:hypothetical protein RT761_02326 [Atribacter laminatus]|uniref:Uncharacterized protein n=2 Tax=Atribacter laminatus TaxID=2847778 RepID=A0A7T1F3G9_ATRLM|nr:hypothetical protein RT761_02326 [Atribacter laminatus]
MDSIIGMQIHFIQELFDEGIEKALLFLRNEGKINSIFVASQHDYLDSSGFDSLYHNKKRNKHVVNGYFFDHQLDKYDSTPIKPMKDVDLFLSSKDPFGDIQYYAKKLGFKFYAMILNRWPQSDLFPDCHMKSINGKIIPKVLCANNPKVMNLYKSIIKDLATKYDLDGIFLALLDHYVQFGFIHLTDELAYSLGIKRFNSPEVGLACFCDYCTKKATSEGIDIEKIKKGLYRGIEMGIIPHHVENITSPDEVFNFLDKVPEFLQWMHFRSKSFTEIHKELYKYIKKLNPSIQVALNTYGPADSWKYAANFNDLVSQCDWVKPMFYSGTYPGLPKTPEQVKVEMSKAVKYAKDKPVVAGINGIGSASNLENIRKSFSSALSAGSKGLILSWDYALIPLEHITYFGKLCEEVFYEKGKLGRM